MNIVLNRGCTLLPSFSNEPDFPIARSASTGSPTAETAKPRNAGIKDEPASYAKNGGKIRFPAPKNIEKTVSESMILFLLRILGIISCGTGICFRIILGLRHGAGKER